MTCETCGGKGWGWFKDARLPWVPESGYDEKTDMHWDALACLAVTPCHACQSESHAQWLIYHKKSLAAWRATGRVGKVVPLTDAESKKYHEELEKLGVSNYRYVLAKGKQTEKEEPNE